MLTYGVKHPAQTAPLPARPGHRVHQQLRPDPQLMTAELVERGAEQQRAVLVAAGGPVPGGLRDSDREPVVLARLRGRQVQVIGGLVRVRHGYALSWIWSYMRAIAGSKLARCSPHFSVSAAATVASVVSRKRRCRMPCSSTCQWLGTGGSIGPCVRGRPTRSASAVETGKASGQCSRTGPGQSTTAR